MKPILNNNSVSILMVLLICCLDPAARFYDRSAPANDENTRALTEQLEDRIPELMQRYKIPGAAIALIKQSQIQWIQAFGFANREYQHKLSRSAIFRVESISKPITAWGVMKLAEGGMVKLDDPVQQYLHNWTLPKSEYNLDGVTIRRLLSNSAGMPQGTVGLEYAPKSQKPSLDQYLTHEARLEFEPGSGFQYSNPGFNILELMIEEVTGRDFNDYMENEVLEPLGMYTSSFNWKDDWAGRVPLGYDLQGQPVSPYVYPYKASGGLMADIGDIARFVIAEMDTSSSRKKVVLSNESLQILLTPQVKASGIFRFVADSYSFGHFIERLPGGLKAFWHGGQGHGWMTHFHAVPETGDGIVIFTNSQRSWPFMARVLNEWSMRQEFGPLKFGRIAVAETGLRISVWIILLITLGRAIQIVYGLITGKRRPRPGQRPVPVTRISEFSFGVILLGILIWAVSQDYLFISSIFPLDAYRLGLALLFLALILLTSAIFPVIQEAHDFSIKNPTP